MRERWKPSSGLSLADMLTVLFVALKLTGHIDWSWWWVLAPCWIGLAAVVLVALLMEWIEQ